MHQESVDVAIVGAGPVGVAAACLLARRGLSVAGFERERDVYHQPRAAHFDAEIMRIWQEIGIADELAACTVAGAGMHFLNAEGRKLFGVDSSTEPGPLGWAASYMFHQPDLEKTLRRRARALGVALHLGHDVESIDPGRVGADLATLRVRDLSNEAPRTVRARWVLGCDGARSLTRGAIGTRLEDLRCDQPWLVVDVVLTRAKEMPAFAIQYCDPARPATYVPMPGARRRFEFMLLPGDTREEIERPERVAALLAPWLRRDQAEIERAVVYTFHALLASPWWRERAFLLGDAAHQMPPFLGQGMCSGIRDAANLAWKLDLVSRGLAAPQLLDSYEQERSPHVRAIIQVAVGAGNVIQTTDPAVAAARDASLLGDSAPPLERGFMPPLTAGLLHRPGEDPAAGKLLPQPRHEDRLLDEALGTGFAVVAGREPSESLTEESLGVWRRLGGRFLATSALARWLESHGAHAVVVRPDRYVFGVARAPGDLDRLIDALRVRLG